MQISEARKVSWPLFDGVRKILEKKLQIKEAEVNFVEAARAGQSVYRGGIRNDH